MLDRLPPVTNPHFLWEKHICLFEDMDDKLPFCCICKKLCVIGIEDGEKEPQFTNRMIYNQYEEIVRERIEAMRTTCFDIEE